tara:strand:+ start:130 stop:444 length:315 start_codon:yes stop_codon:yes gene_type:complete
MKKDRNHIVIQKWKSGTAAMNGRGTLHAVPLPDGSVDLFSYDLKIGHRTAGGACVVANYTAPGGDFRSMTTSQHVNLAKKAGEYPLVMHPLVWAQSPMREQKPF